MGRSRSRSRDRSRRPGRSRSRSRESKHHKSSRDRSRSRESNRRRDHHHHHKEEKKHHDRRDERHHHHRDDDRRDRSRDSRKDRPPKEDGDGSRSRHRDKEERRREREDQRSNGVDKSTGGGEEGKQHQQQQAGGGGKEQRRGGAGEDEGDESPVVLMVGLSEEDEEREMAERKRKRQQVLEEHKRKLQEEKRQLEGFINGKTPAEVEEAEAEEERIKRKRKADGEAAEPEPQEGSDDEEDEDETVVVTTQHKVMSDEEQEDEDEERKRGTGGEEEAAPALDMFSFSPSKANVLVKPGQGYIEAAAFKAAGGEGADHGEDWDDPEGYYKTMAGEVLADRYVVMGAIGRGVFSTVLKCKDKKTQNEDGSLAVVAIKMVRNNDVMRKAAQRELDLLREISATDPENKKHCVRLLGQFEHRNHVAMVFESLQMNLRETLRKFGKHVGINIGAVRTYAKQLLVALKHIGNLNIVHADIKPDNILVNEGFSQLKLCDFGSGFKEDAADNAPTPYLVSRFYRAPEVILYGDYSKAVDLWSIGCCLYELFTGRVAFPGANNNEMIRLMMELKGPLPIKNIRKHRQAYVTLSTEPLFEDDGRFRQREVDPVTKNPTVRLVHYTKPTRDLTNILLKAKTASDDRQMVLNLANLLDKIFTLDPTKRITVKEALHHPFISASGGKNA